MNIQLRQSKDSFYLSIAKAVAERSTCLRRRYGAVIVKDDEIISCGYNGSPRGEENCNEIGNCPRENTEHGSSYEICRSVHAEMNAIISASRNEMIGSTLYLYGEEGGEVILAEPCSICSRLIKNAGIKKIVGSLPIKVVNKHEFKINIKKNYYIHISKDVSPQVTCVYFDLVRGDINSEEKGQVLHSDRTYLSKQLRGILDYSETSLWLLYDITRYVLESESVKLANLMDKYSQLVIKNGYAYMYVSSNIFLKLGITSNNTIQYNFLLGHLDEIGGGVPLINRIKYPTESLVGEYTPPFKINECKSDVYKIPHSKLLEIGEGIISEELKSGSLII